jgi:hypothetical protein
MKHRIAVGACLVLALACGYATAADELKSGPQVGEGIPAFSPLNVFNCEIASKNGTKSCLV